MTWDLTSPADTDPIRQGASAIRTFKSDLQTALDTEGVFPGATPSAPVFRWVPRRGTQASRPANDPVNPGTTYYNTDLNEWEVDTGTAWVAMAQVIPSGSVMAYVAASAPPGWLNCDGSAVSRTTYANLFSVIGITHGQGDGSTTFNLPDYRGQFLRMVDGSAGRDPDNASRTAMNTGGNSGNAIGSVQLDEVGAHGHTVTDPKHQHTSTGNGVETFGVGGSFLAGNFNGTQTTTPDLVSSSATGLTVNNSTGTETRPKNAYCSFIIKT